MSAIISKKEFLSELKNRITRYENDIDDIGYVCGQDTRGKVMAVNAKIGKTTRILELKKTVLALQVIEASILNGEYPESCFYSIRRVNRSVSQIFGKNAKISI